MSLISTYGNGIRYLDNLITISALYDGICYSGYGRIFDGTQVITFPLAVPTEDTYYLVYYDFNTTQYEQIPYSSTTFSTAGSYSNFIIWSRYLTNVEMTYITQNIEFLYVNNLLNIVTVEDGAPITLNREECLMWIPMLPTEGSTVQDYVSKTDATITNYSSDTIIEDSNIGPQWMAYTWSLNQVDNTVVIRDSYIHTNLILPLLSSWSIEEIVRSWSLDEITLEPVHYVYVYDYTRSICHTYINGEYAGYKDYTPTQSELLIGNTSFEGSLTSHNVDARYGYTIFDKMLNNTDIRDLYYLYLLKDYALTTKQGTVLLTNTNISGVTKTLTYNPNLQEI
jgi:hypothetical protein